MTILMDRIRALALSRPHELAIDGGAAGELSWLAFHGAVQEYIDFFSMLFTDRRRPVGILLDHGPVLCAVDLALLEAGIPSLSIPRFFTEQQREHALRESGAQALIVARPSPSSDLPIDIEEVRLLEKPLPAGTAKITFTSGSTGTPKGICLSADHMTAVAGAVVEYVGEGHAGRQLPLLPPGILLENVAGFYASILSGGTYVPLPQAKVGMANPFQPDFAAMAAAIGRTRATSLILVPEYLRGLVTVLEKTGQRLPHLTLVAVGGAYVSPALLERAEALGLPVRQGYGLTECASVITLEQKGEKKRGSVGSSIGLNCVFLAPDGEIIVYGPSHLGAVGKPREATPFRTGDIGRFDKEGRLWIEGRKSNLIITSYGRNISPEWVEGILVEEDAIAQAMVYGDGAAALSALIAPAYPEADIAAAIMAANTKLPTYAHIHAWRLVPAFTPANGHLTGNGRPRRKAIADTYLKEASPMSFFHRLVNETRGAQGILLKVPQLQAGLAGRISRKTYVSYLTEAYHHVRHTVPLMQAARARLQHRPEIVAALDDYIKEETGHEQWILNDIAVAGGDARKAAQGRPSAATQAMVDHAYATIETGNPMSFFGMVYVLEGASIALAEKGARAVRDSLGLPPGAFTYLTSHGALDMDHMRYFERLMDTVTDPADQDAIIAMAQDMFGLFAGVFAAIDMEDLHENA